MEKKTCSKCGNEKPNTTDFFYMDRGNISHRCKECRGKYHKDWVIKNRDKKREYDKNYRIQNLDKLNKYAEMHKEEKSVYNASYWDENKEEIRARRKKNRPNENRLRNKKRNERRKYDPLFKLKERIRTKLGKVFRNNGYKKKCKTFDIIGCTFEELKKHLEAQFKPWMNWNNYGKYNGKFDYGWDIDHIIPLSSATTEEEILKLWHYTNLQPLCSKINREIKRNKKSYLLINE